MDKKPVGKLSGRFVKENFGDKQKLFVGEKFIKQWTFRNDGDCAWPVGIKFSQRSGDQMTGKTLVTNQKVLPGTDYTWEIEIDAPNQVGRYTAYFRMATPDEKLFGHKVWCDIMTVEPEKKPEVQQVVPVEPIVIE